MDSAFGKNHSTQSAFSLVELMIVIVIIGLLAAIAVPVYNKNVEHAIRAEGEAALGSIRTQVLVYYGEHGHFPVEDLSRVVTQSWHSIKEGELDGRYFSESSYYYQCFDGVDYLIGLHRGEVMELHRSLNQDGQYENWDLSVDE